LLHFQRADTIVPKPCARTALLTIAEASDLLGFHELKVRNWVRAGKLPGFKIGNKWRTDTEDFDLWRKQRRNHFYN